MANAQSSLARDPNNHAIQTFEIDTASIQNITVATASAATSSAVGKDIVMLTTNTDCYVTWAASPTATTSDLFLPAGAIVFLKIDPAFKVAAIRDSADGKMSVATCK